MISFGAPSLRGIAEEAACLGHTARLHRDRVLGALFRFSGLHQEFRTEKCFLLINWVGWGFEDLYFCSDWWNSFDEGL